MALSGLDLRVLTHELNEQLIGTWIVNIYQIPEKIFIFKIRKPQVGLLFFLIEPGKRVHMTNFNRTMPKEPANFCKTLRSHLREKRINSIEQRDLDRILILNIGPDEGYTLVIELFGQGNIILVSPENRITTALSYRKMRDRDIHPGRDYIHMPRLPTDILRNQAEGIESAITDNPKLVPALNNWLGLGPAYSRYIVRQAGITGKKTEGLKPEDLSKITAAAKTLYSILSNHDYSPIVFLDKEPVEEAHHQEMGEIDDTEAQETQYDEQWEDEALAFNPEEVVKILPFYDDKYSDEGIEVYNPTSMSEAFDIYFSSQETIENYESESIELETETEKLTRLLNQQTEHQTNLLSNAKVTRRQADALYANFQEGVELLSTIYDARKQNMKWEDIEERLSIGRKKGIKSAKLFAELKINSGEISLKLPIDEEIVKATVDFRISLQDNANILYASAKKSERKARGADIAINRTKDKIEQSKTTISEKRAELVGKTPVLKRRKQWFEKFHWTITPSNFLIISGYDASTNERLVKRYLDDDDLFFHADVQGASATIIKTDTREMTDKVLSIAAQMAVSYSGLWGANRPTGDVYYVQKDQVSLSAPTGEYLPKGSFMIYGQKEYLRTVHLKLIIALIVENNWVRLVTGFDEIKTHHQIWVELEPGETERGSIAKQIKRRFSSLVEEKDQPKVKALDLGEIAFLLPGKSNIISWSR